MAKGTYCYHCGARITQRGKSASHHNVHQHHGEPIIEFSLCHQHMHLYADIRHTLTGDYADFEPIKDPDLEPAE